MILRLAFCYIIQLLKMFGLEELGSWGGNSITHVYSMLEKYKSYQNKWQACRRKEGCLCGWKGIGSVRNVSSALCWGLLTDNTGQFCDGSLYRLSLPEHPALPAVTAQSNNDGRWYRPQPLQQTNQLCSELATAVQKLANCATAGMAVSFIPVSSCWPCY